MCHITSTEKPQISHSKIVESDIAKANEVLVNEEVLVLKKLFGDNLNALFATDASSDDTFLKEII